MRHDEGSVPKKNYKHIRKAAIPLNPCAENPTKVTKTERMADSGTQKHNRKSV